MQSVDPNDYGLFRRQPDGCDIPTGCRYFAGLRLNEGNSSYLDVFLSAETMGWVAIGFSDTNSMVSFSCDNCPHTPPHTLTLLSPFPFLPPHPSPPLPSPQQRSDVLGCNRLEGSGNVVVVDTNNLPGEGTVFDNQLDDPDEQVTNLMAIMCSDIQYTCIYIAGSRMISYLELQGLRMDGSVARK